MRLRRVDAVDNTGPVDGPRSASARWTARSGVLLRVEGTDGRVGFGEASPLPGYSPDTLTDARTAFARVDFGKIPEIDEGESASEWLARWPEPCAKVPSARFALETALLDVVAQRRDVALHRLFSEEAGAVPLCHLLGGADDPSSVVAASRALAAGATTLKLKIAGPVLTRQMDTLERIRSAAKGFALRLDANRTLPADTLDAELTRLAPLAPEFVEEPSALSVLLGAVSPAVPTALDESLQDEGAWTTLRPHLARLRCAAVVLKPAALGGFGACIRWAGLARAHGLAVTVSHAFDGPIALAAAGHLALAIASRTVASGLASHRGLDAWPAAELPLIRPTHVVAPTAPGLGATLATE